MRILLFKYEKFFLCALLLMIVLFSCRFVFNHSSPDEDNDYLLPYPFSSVVEYDTTSLNYYGRIRVSESDYFGKIHSVSGNTHLLKRLPLVDGWPRGISAIDVVGQKFYFVAGKDLNYRLYTVDMTSGEVLNSVILSDIIHNIEFDPATKTLLGVLRSDSYRFVSLDAKSGDIKVKSDLPSITTITSKTILQGNDFYFIGGSGNEQQLQLIDTRTGKANQIQSLQVDVDEYRIVDFKKSAGIEAVFTTNVQSCTAIAGYDSVSAVGFIAHFSPAFEAMAAALSDINGSVQQLNGEGLKAMKCCVVGGIRGQADSVDNMMTAFAELERYGVSYEEMIKHNTGVSHSLFLYKGVIRIF